MKYVENDEKQMSFIFIRWCLRTWDVWADYNDEAQFSNCMYI